MALWRVRLHPDGRWQVLTPGETQACRRVETQHEAIAAALQLASEEGGGEVLVEDVHGKEDHRRTAPQLQQKLLMYPERPKRSLRRGEAP